MADGTEPPQAKLPDPNDRKKFAHWLTEQPREWSTVIAGRAALRCLPLVVTSDKSVDVALPIFRAAAVSRFAGKYPGGEFASAASSAFAAATTVGDSARRNFRIEPAAYAAGFAAATVDKITAATAATAAAAAADPEGKGDENITRSFSVAVKLDAQRLHDRELTAQQLAAERLWLSSTPPKLAEAWLQLKQRLLSDGAHWQIWIDGYENGVLHEPYRPISKAQEAAFTDLPGKLPWDAGAEAVNTEIMRRLSEIGQSEVSSKVPEQVAAPVVVEERSGKVSKVSDRSSVLSASERDFKAWRDPVNEHIEELTTSDFAAGTNHGRVRERLTKLAKLLPGDISEVKENQFKIGYEIDRFEGLMAAYRTGGEDMPVLNAAQLEDLDRLRVALKMGIDKLERWSEFRKAADESIAGEADADREVVGEALDKMAAVMEQHSQYFDPQLPATFRFLSEAVRDRSGAAKTVVYGAVKSAENLISFLGQRAIGIGKKGVEAVETHISKAVATALVTGLGGAAVALSGALPQGWAWLKPLLSTLGVAG